MEFKKSNDGCAPTIREIMSSCGISTTSVVSYHLAKLEKENKISRPGDKASRMIMVTGGKWGLR